MSIPKIVPVRSEIGVYVAMITQTGTAAPTVTVLQNTLRSIITWARLGTGGYTATANPAIFVPGRTTAQLVKGNQGTPSTGSIVGRFTITTSEILFLQSSTVAPNGNVDEIPAGSFVEIKVYAE